MNKPDKKSTEKVKDLPKEKLDESVTRSVKGGVNPQPLPPRKLPT